jgi:RNA-directed DNA polymerase
VVQLHRPTRPFGPHRYKKNGAWYLSASPSKKSVQRFKRSIASVLVPANNDPWPEVCDQLNRSMRGWSNYFCHGDLSPKNSSKFG